MPSGIYKRTKIARENMSKARTGKTMPPISEITRSKLKKGRIGNKPTLGKHWKVKDTSKMKGHTPKSAFKKGCVPKHCFKKGQFKGENNFNWKGGITSKSRLIRKSVEIRLWREAVFARDNWTDQKTGIKGGKLHAHHILNFSSCPELRTSIENGITFSKESHREFHRIYGIKNNTREQVIEFLNNK